MALTNLPIWSYHEEILDAIKKHQVVVVTSPTGTGKTTQVPHMILDSGLAGNKRVGVTQPRRIAATSVASFVAKQRETELGNQVGYKIRFDDHTTPATDLKFMTDGVLLMEAQTDPELNQYGVIIIDEAHERSQNIDFAMGLLKKLLQGARADDLRVVIMSATIQPEFFSEFFDGAPVISATAPMFPVEVLYHPVDREDPKDLVRRTVDAVKEIQKEGEPGDILVFLPGAGPIRDVVRALRGPGFDDLMPLPLYARLSTEEQQSVFKSYPGLRKVICSTNIAETSITIEGVSFVIDSGVMKINEFLPNLGVSALREKTCPLASLDQRKGRAGRTRPGVCIRLFDPKELPDRPKHIRPAILRADLSEVVLKLLGLGVHDVMSFPFPTRPSRKDLRAAFTLLEKIDACDEERQITDIGRKLLHFPLSPRVGRMILEAELSALGVVDEVLTIAAFLSTSSPYPFFEDFDLDRVYRHELAKRFGQKHGDAILDLRVFQAYQRANGAERFIDKWKLDPKTMLELKSIYEQLREIAESNGIEITSGGSSSDVIRCLAKAYPPFILKRGPGRQYLSETLKRVFIHPGSTLYEILPDYIVAGEIVETSRMYARKVSHIDKETQKSLDLKTLEYVAANQGRSLPQSEGRRRRKADWWDRVGKKKHGGKNKKGKRRRR
jgi:HrpA-like RNA helicase